MGDIQSQFPTCGNKQMMGHLQSRGYRVQQIRVREAQRRVDPIGTIVRRLNRREYSVAGPRSFYHIDGHHKLIRYALVIVFKCGDLSVFNLCKWRIVVHDSCSV